MDRVRLLPNGSTFAERWRVERCLRAGGMGAVYETAHVDTGAPAAVKVMKPDLVAGPDLERRFRQEAVVTARIQSDHIVTVFDAGTDAETGMPYIVMELLRGADLGTRLDERGAFTPAQVVLLLHQVAHALDRTHAEGVVHRDLKPSNLIVVQRDDGSPCVKVIDFGIAKIVAQSGPAKTTMAAGTPFYMAPEQVMGDGHIGPAADRYALAQVAYTLLVGQAYWEPTFAAEGKLFPVLRGIQSGSGPPASQQAAEAGVQLSPAFDVWFAQATATAPASRFASVHDQIDALAQALGAQRPRPTARWW